MDSLTQIALGAAVGGAICGRKYGRRAALVGAVLGTVPDLDVLISVPDPVASFTSHRGFSHSIVFAVIATPIFVFLLSVVKWFRVSFRDWRWYCAVFFVLLTHILLDAMTIYGTQIFWPLALPPVGIGSVFIIDPFYTVPLLIGCVWFFCNKSVRPLCLALIISTLYLGWSVYAQKSVTEIAKKSFVPNAYFSVLALPTPFNTFLWRIVFLTPNGYAVGYYSVFDNHDDIAFTHYKSDRTLLAGIGGDMPVIRLQWFTKGFYAVDMDGEGRVAISDIRMGFEPSQYHFRYVVGQRQNGETVPVENYRQALGTRSLSRLGGLWRRIWDENEAF